MSEHLERRAPDTGRVPVETLVEICGNEPGIPAFEAETVDVSARGMHLRTAYLPDQGAPLVCRFEDQGREIVVEGVVAWRREGARGGEFGVEFTALDGRSVDALRRLCMSGDAGADSTEADAEHATGSRVRLHIEGLGSPMKARVRGADPRRVQVGSNLEFLKVGRKLEIEDLERGGRKTAQIDAVSVAIDPQTQVPQLVVALRFESAEESTPEPSVTDVARDGAAQAFSIPVESVTTDVAADSPGAPEATAPSEPAQAAEAVPSQEGEDDADAQALKGRLGVAASSAGEAAKVASARLADFSTRASRSLGDLFKGASAKVLELAQKRDAKKAPRRQTASIAPVSIEKQRLRPQSQAPAAAADAPARALGALRTMPKKKLAVLAGGGVLALSVAAFAMRPSSAPPGAAAAPEGSVTSVVGAPPQAFPSAPPPAAPGAAVTANVPMFGPTPMATMEPVPLAAPPPQSEEAAERAEAEASEASDEAFPDEGGSNKASKSDKPGSKTKPEDVAPWGRGKVSTPTIYRLRLDAAGSAIQGVQQPTGFMVVLPGRKLMEQAAPIAKRDARFASVRSVNTPNGAQITFNFKESVPAYRVRLRRDYVEFLIGEGTKSTKAAPAKAKSAVAKPAKKH